ncbi:MAG: ABC transporter permease, partial [Vicinamibacteria bacterium]
MIRALGPLLGLALVYLFFVLVGPEAFGTFRTLETIARQTAIVGTAALGMTLVIVSGGIDLSVGSIVAMSSVIVALVLDGGFGGPLTAVAAAMLAGAFCGFVSGTLITRLRVAPFIVTLGMLLLVRGVAKGLGKEQKVDAPMTWLVELLSSLPPEWRWMLVPPGVWLLGLLALATAVVLRYT